MGYLYIDTGAMYRAIALWALRNGTSLDDHHRLEQLASSAEVTLDPSGRICLNGEDVTTAIREPEISQAASRISTVAGVRRALVEKQRAFAAQTSVVMEGRDIGTVVFPEAQVKIFLDADPGVRATRRLRELEERGVPAEAGTVQREIAERDERDRTRAEAPLIQAPDAVYFDSTPFTLDEVEERVLSLVREKTSNGKEVGR
jgi:cytidylate kinase